MKIDNYLESLNDDDKNTFYYLLGEMGLDESEIMVKKEPTENEYKNKTDFIKEEIQNTQRKILKTIEGAYNSDRINEDAFKYDLEAIKNYMFMIHELEREIENEEVSDEEF